MFLPIAGGPCIEIRSVDRMTSNGGMSIHVLYSDTCNPIQYFNGQPSENCQLGTK